MSLLNWLLKKNNKEHDDQEISDAGFCPNCWGSQSYDGKFIQAVKDQQIDVNNKNSQHQRAFIQEFVKTHLEPIRLKNHDTFNQCAICKVKYTKSSQK